MAKSMVNWKKRILLPFWIIRICLLLVVLIGFSAAISLNEDDSGGHVRYPAAAAFLVCTILVLLLDIVQIVLWFRDKLHPSIFAGLAVFQAVFWGLVMILDIVAIARNQQSPGAMGLVAVMFLLYLGLFIYASRGYMRERKLAARGHYVSAHNSNTSADLKPSYGTAYDQSDTAHRSLMHNGGDLGESASLIPMHDQTIQHYHDQHTRSEHKA